MLVLKVLGEVHLVLGLVDGDKIPLGDGDHVHLLLLVLLHGHRPLPDADCDLVVGDGVPVLQRVDLELLLVVLDHRAELPVGVGRVLDQSEMSIHSRCDYQSTNHSSPCSAGSPAPPGSAPAGRAASLCSPSASPLL